MITIKTPEEIEKLRLGGKILADILNELEKFCQENYLIGQLTTMDVSKKADQLMKERGVLPAFRNAKPPFPTGLCISVNDEVVHGVPGNKTLKAGDIVGLDLGVIYLGLYTDAAISIIIGKGERVDEMLAESAKKALFAGIDKAIIGNTVGDIGNAIEKNVKDDGFVVIDDYCGHGVGYSVHEDPSVPNYGEPGKGETLEEGMVIAIEPMISLRTGETYVDKNGWSVKTADGENAAHWEHTIAITKNGPVILTE